MKHRRRTQEDTQPLDPIPLTLAVWLGVIVGITGLVRLSENAADRAAQTQAAAQGVPQPMRDVRPMVLRTVAYGG